MKWIVDKDETEKALGAFLQKQCSLQETENTISYRQIKRLIDAGNASVNEKIERFHNRALRPGDRVSFTVDLKESKKSTPQPIIRLFEDESILVINKPIGTTSDERLEKKLNALLVHRLDKETSGCLLLAKSVEIRKLLFEQFRKREVKKEYIAIVLGQLPQHEGHIENYLSLVSRFHGGVIWGVNKDGKGELAITDWEVIQVGAISGTKVSSVRLMPLTGRTHQLRVHMSFLGHPIVGDPIYGKPFSLKNVPERLYLHAQKLSFIHPITNKNVEIIAQLPDDFNKII